MFIVINYGIIFAYRPHIETTLTHTDYKVLYEQTELQIQSLQLQLTIAPVASFKATLSSYKTLWLSNREIDDVNILPLLRGEKDANATVCTRPELPIAD